MTLTFGSLFSGIGGFDLGFEQAGMQCAWQCEIDKRARSVLATHWPVPCYEDVKNVKRDNVAAVDLICGGFPCQDVSIAGKREGLAGERSGFWFEFHRIIGEIRPQWVIVENVPGLLSSHRGADFAVILRGLVECGYGVAWRILDAQYFGVAQRRRRVFIVGSLRNGRSAEVLFECKGLFGHPPARREERQDIAGTLATGAHASGFNGRDAERGNIVAGPIGAHHSRHDLDNDTYIVEPQTFDWQASSSVSSVIDPPGVTRELLANRTLALSNALTSHPGRYDQDNQTYVIARHGTQNHSNMAGVRRLTPTECTRLQGFPDDWQEVSDADETQAHAREVLHGMWREIGAKNREGRRLRIALALLTPEILLAGVHGGWISWEMAARSATASREIQGKDTWPEGFLCALWQAREARPSPYRRQSFEQFARELGRPLQELPLEGAQARAHLLSSKLWPQASQEWPLRYAQPESEARPGAVLSDSARYRQLGNAVAVPVARWIGQRIVEMSHA